MSSQMTLKVGNTTATLPIGANVTDAQVGQALTRYANSLGIPMTGTAQENLTAVLAHVLDDIRRRAKSQQLVELRAAQDAANQAAADADTQL